MSFRTALEKLNPKKVSEKFAPDIKLAQFITNNQDKALFFENVNGWRVAANVCIRENMNKLFGAEIKQKVVNALENRIEPKIVGKHNFKQIETDLTKLPILMHFKSDAGPYMTSCVYIAESKEHGRNLSYHRTLVRGKDWATARITHRDLWKYYEEAGKTLDVAICIGLDPAVLIAAGTSVDINIDETGIAGGLLGKPIELVKMENGVCVPKDSEIVMLAKMTPEEDDEGPFVDLTGTVDVVRKQPVIKIEKIYTQENPIYHALVSSKDEHGFLMGFPKEPVIFHEVSKIAKVKDVCLTKGGVYWLDCAVSIEDGNPKEVIDAVLKAHKSVKNVFVFDSDIDIYNADEREWAFATRFQAHRGFYHFPNSPGSSIDPSADLTGDRHTTSKVGFDCTIPKDRKREKFLRAEYREKGMK